MLCGTEDVRVLQSTTTLVLYSNGLANLIADALWISHYKDQIALIHLDFKNEQLDMTIRLRVGENWKHQS